MPLLKLDFSGRLKTLLFFTARRQKGKEELLVDY
jgi:hypothetical protein